MGLKGASEGVCGTDAARRGLGILLDTERHYEVPDLDDRYRLKPAVLRSFGWQIAWVLTRDWMQARDTVLARIERLLDARTAPPDADVAGTV